MGWEIIDRVILLFIVTFLVISLFASVPVQTFLRYYALLVLGHTNVYFDLIPERRSLVQG